MDNRELVSELSLKYNTLKMYENTIKEMEKRGFVGNSLDKLKSEKEEIELDFLNLLDPRLVDDEQQSENEFIKSLHKNNLYRVDKDFFNDFSKSHSSEEKNINDKKPTFGEIQDKISSSQWISHSNFIARIPKNIFDIDEWRVSHIYFEFVKPTFLKNGKYPVGGTLDVFVNDFSYVKDDGSHNILLQSIINAYKLNEFEKSIGDILIDVIDNSGNELYTIKFINCKFKESYPEIFDYKSTDLRTVGLRFEYEDLDILPPNDETAN